MRYLDLRTKSAGGASVNTKYCVASALNIPRRSEPYTHVQVSS